MAEANARMTTVIERAIREPEIESARQYARGVRLLAAAYLALLCFSLAGIGILIWQAQLYVTLSQRSNVETLTLAFLFVFFAYLAALSAPGAWGAAHLVYFGALALVAGDRDTLERRKMRALGPPKDQPAVVALNLVLEPERHPNQTLVFTVADSAGSMGRIEVQGVRVAHHPATKSGSNNLLAFTIQQVNQILSARGAPAGLDIVEWHRINDESAQQYVNLVRFACNLERHLGANDLWPKRTLTSADHAEVERRLAAVCPSLRNEAFLPHWEYMGEHKIPLIPEPLGLLSLSRTEKRVDPLASMGCAVSIVIVVVAILLLFFFFPPWVPGM